MIDRASVAEDEVTVDGLAVLLDEDIEIPFLELTIHARGRRFSAVILAVEDEWAVNVRDEAGGHQSGDENLYPSQSGAILAALLISLSMSRDVARY